MRASTIRTKLLAWWAVAGLAGGCGLIKGDIGTLVFQLPSKSFSFDTASSGWKAPPGNFPMVACGAGQAVTDCCNPPPPAPKPDCVATPLACVNGACVLEFPVTVNQRIDLKSEVPALSSLGGQTLAEVSIKQIQYTIASNMNVELPAIDIYVAPDGATTTADPAKKFGTIPPTPAGATRSGDVVLDPDGQAAFSMYASHFTTPFTLIAHTTMVVAPGTPAPTGKVDVTVTGKVGAKPSL
jgi:hypothetical protein